MVKTFIKKFIPKNFLLFYHKFLALFASFLYQNPSEKLVVIGVTGTAGKSTTVYLIAKILEEAGFKVGWTNSISFKIGDREIENRAKMTMPGRFFMQKILKEMVRAGCQYAVIETSSEGILQSRHLGINYDIAVFTNLSPEHIEAHGGFENYKKTKAELFASLTKNRTKKFVKIRDQIREYSRKIIIANLDDKEAEYFLSFSADEYYGYTLRDANISRRKVGILRRSPILVGVVGPTSLFTDTNEASGRMHTNDTNKVKIVKAEEIKGSEFKVYGLGFKVNLLGKFNIYNVLAAISVAQTLEIPLETAKKALEKIKGLPGRMEEVISQPFKVIIDYAHTPVELEGVYQTLANLHKSTTNNTNIREISDQICGHSRMICVLGSCGGGRDKWKRPELGKLAAQFCDAIILTDEDPYDENPATIIDEIEAGFSQIRNSNIEIRNYEKILDRREAIKRALAMAKENDIVIITGKGSEPWMCVADGKKIPWDDRQIAKDEFKKIFTP